jgi:chromosome segregation ATPase
MAKEWNEKIAQQKEKIVSLNHDLDLYQRELRLREAAVYSDSSTGALAIREAQYRTDIDAKQKAIDDARQQLDEMREQARKAGVAANELDKTSNKDDNKD